MLKRTMIIALTFAFSFANEIVYSQNNPPRQNEVTRKWAVSVNSDIFISQISGILSSDFLFTTDTVTNFETVYAFPNTPKVGFGIGVGVALNEVFNISLQYRYLRSGGTQTVITKKSPDLEVNIFLPFDFISKTNLKAYVEGNDNKNLHIVDFLVQMSASLTSKILLQPFAGLVTIRHNENLVIQAHNIENPSEKVLAEQRREQTLNGVLIGSDIRFLINRTLHFFASIKTSITSFAKDKTMTSEFNDFDVPVRFSEVTYDTSQRITHHWEYRFGFAFNHVFKNDWLLSLRIFTEMHSELFENYGFGATFVF